MGSDAVPQLRQLLRSGRPPLGALGALVRLGPAACSAVPELIECLARDDASLRMYAVLALRAIGPAAIAAIPSLIAELGREPIDSASDVARALGAIGVEAIAPLMKVLHRGTADASSEAAFALGEMGTAGAPAWAALRRALEHPNDATRLHAAVALGRIGRLPPRAGAVLLTFLPHSDFRLRFTTASALIRHAGEIGGSEIPLTAALEDREVLVRIAARYALDSTRAERVPVAAVPAFVSAPETPHPALAALVGAVFDGGQHVGDMATLNFRDGRGNQGVHVSALWKLVAPDGLVTCRGDVMAPIFRGPNFSEENWLKNDAAGRFSTIYKYAVLGFVAIPPDSDRRVARVAIDEAGNAEIVLAGGAVFQIYEERSELPYEAWRCFRVQGNEPHFVVMNRPI